MSYIAPYQILLSFSKSLYQLFQAVYKMSLLLDKTGHFVGIQRNRETEFSSLIDSYIERTALLADEMDE